MDEHSKKLSNVDEEAYKKNTVDGSNAATETEQKRWIPEHRLNQIPEDAFKKAIELADSGLIHSVSIINNDKGEAKVKVTYYFDACRYGIYNNIQAIKRESQKRSVTVSLTDSLGTCTKCCCHEKRCIPLVAGYIKYSKDHGTYDVIMEERNRYRREHNDEDENLLFTWEPRDKDKLKNLPAYIFNLAEDLIAKGFVALRPYPNEDGKFYADFKKIGNCTDQNSEKAIVGSIWAGPHDIKRNLSFINEYASDLKNGWLHSKTAPFATAPIANCECKAPMCPYSVAQYILYLRLTGQEDVIAEAKQYSATHPDEIYYGTNNFAFSFSDADMQKIKQSIASAPLDILKEAFRLLDDGDVSLITEKVKDGNTYYYTLNSSRAFMDGQTVSECVEVEYQKGSRRFWQGSAGLDDYTGISIRYRLVRLITAIDYCRRTGVDLSEVVNKREQDIANLRKLSDDILGLDRVYSFIKSDKTSSLSCIIQGDIGSGKGPIIDSIADILCQNGKISTSKYKKMTLQQLSEILTTHKTRSEHYDALTNGYEFSYLEENQLYVLTGLEEFLLYTGVYSINKGYMTTGTALHHLIKVLGSFSKNTYLLIVSLSAKSTDQFLELNKRFKYTYGQNMVILKNKPANDLYQDYIDELSENVKKQIDDEKQYRKRFMEFIALNEKFLPFSNSGLSHYLAEYSNVEGKPVFPPDVYDKKAVADSLDDMIGMQAVKDQLTAFESYITFQKKAKAEGIEINLGNLHMQFLGNPGTGKTTIARTVAKMLYDIGILEENKVIEVDRKDLVAQYTGQSAPKTNEKIKEAMGGVLFIDEAYGLYLNENDTFGKEVIATLIKAMEEYKDKLIVIFAGYDKEMQDFLKANSGIESRIGYTFHFEDYTASELTEIFRRSVTKQNFVIGDGVLKKVSDICNYYRRRKNFGNGRFAKKVEQQTIINHANNMNCDGWDIKTLTIEDVPEIKDLGTKSSGGQENELTLEQIIGMNGVKDQIRKFRTKIHFEQKAKAAGARIKRGNSHMLFLGNPGTGKTTIARIITNELYEAGLILENKLIEVERKDLIAQYIGQTAPKTSEIIDRAMGGVLFIDEAYSLTPADSVQDFGQEAVATIIKAMEDHKDEFVVIFAGYEREMQTFLDSNSGIASRIGYTFTFEDYTAEELADIFKLKMEQNNLSYTEEAVEDVQKLMQYFVSVPNFGNGRFAERVVNIAIELHSERVAEQEELTDDLLKITKEDIPSVKYMLDHMPDGKSMINPEQIKDSQHERTAVHELGHALMVKLLTPFDSIERITISAEGSGALGYVRHRINNIGNSTKSDLEAQICVKMAGLAAEEVFLGEYGNGGTSDLESATSIAMNMIMRFGMSKNGFAYFKELDETGKQEVNDILKEQFEKAKKNVEEYRDRLTEAKEYLLCNHTISDDEFTRIVIKNAEEL